MIYSMTGYGASKIAVDGTELSIELKSVNNRYLDVSVRLPRSFMFAEESIKSLVQKHISRGKVDVFVTVDSSKANEVEININEALAESYINSMKTMCEKYGIIDDISATAIARFPDVLTAEKKEIDRDSMSVGIQTVVENALVEFDKMRQAEGDKLCQDILNRVEFLEEMTEKIEKMSPATVKEYQCKLEARMKEILDGAQIDDTRILTEAALFADKVSVTEEVVRLKSHISQLREMIIGASPIGRKLDFLIQELNREINTIGSKCNDIEISKVVVDTKAEIEKIREQVQNIE